MPKKEDTTNDALPKEDRQIVRQRIPPPGTPEGFNVLDHFPLTRTEAKTVLIAEEHRAIARAFGFNEVPDLERSTFYRQRKALTQQWESTLRWIKRKAS